MSKERISVEGSLTSIKSHLRKDEKFSQGLRLYAVYQIKLGCIAEELESLFFDLVQGHVFDVSYQKRFFRQRNSTPIKP